MSLRIISWQSADYSAKLQELLAVLRSGGLVASSEQSSLDVAAIVRDILAQVETSGDEAAAALTARLDRAPVTAQTIRVPASEIARAQREADPAFLALMRRVIANIREYQEHIRHRDPEPLVRGGRKLGVRYTPIDRLGVYVPGGRAIYPSTVLMTVVPAQVAGVREIVMASPPTGGRISDMALALAAELGVQEVLQLGGAVAIAAMAYGTATVRPVQKIVGPGNAFVAEAKRQLFGRVGIDSVAGPSEVVVVADEHANPRWVAADLLAQAEHDPGSAVLVTPSSALAQAVAKEVDTQLAQLERGEAARSSIERYSAAVVVPSLEAACDLATDIAAEHLQLMTADDAYCAKRIRHAGAIFVGAHTPVPLGDYFAGPSHVLPTGGTAKFFGPLSANDFLKASSVIEYDAASLAEDSAGVQDFATREGLTAHAAAARIRGE
ncbi:MAG TPA: histidinol dehydrogenase [Polyangiales bacterium]|jgi:histidinol dehydrogenase|nr:histidinol dehydrogenase [Polyangiales bacterium]